jgi:NAD(P)-dependent dehydrogenase (short-subunit alcohol dehydrogenase family)
MIKRKTAWVSGADRGLGQGICLRLLEAGWQVLAGQYDPSWPELSNLEVRWPGRIHIIPLNIGSMESVSAAAASSRNYADGIDLLINNAGVHSSTSQRSIVEALDYSEMQRLYNINALGALRMVEAFLPQMEHSALKRLCFVSSEAGSIARSQRTAWYGYSVSKAALNMAVRILFNHLRPQGYTLRVYHPGWVRSYMHGEKSLRGDMEPEESAVPAVNYFLLSQDDEDHLVMRDWQGREWPW